MCFPPFIGRKFNCIPVWVKEVRYLDFVFFLLILRSRAGNAVVLLFCTAVVGVMIILLMVIIVVVVGVAMINHALDGYRPVSRRIGKARAWALR